VVSNFVFKCNSVPLQPGSEQGRWTSEEGGAGAAGGDGGDDGGLRTLKRKGDSVASVPRRATACHRVAVYRLDYDAEVMDDTMVIDAVISQSDVIRFMNNHQVGRCKLNPVTHS
jgi:hypothetical protein